MSVLSRPTRATSVEEPPRPETARPGHPALAGITLALALVLTLLLLFHTAVPDVAGLGLILDTVIPWFGLAVPLLLVLALVARRAWSVVGVLVPAVTWALVFVPSMIPLADTADAASGAASGSTTTAAGTAAETLTVASQNVEATSGTAEQSATTLAATGADVIALEELTDDDYTTVDQALTAAYPYSYGIGTVGMWSKFPVVNAQPLTLGLDWNRALAADLQTPAGLVSIYVIHAASARPGAVDDRNAMLSALASTLPRDENERVVVVGDFNAASTDRAMTGILSQVHEPNQTGGMFGDTWPSNLPFTRLDHLFERGMTVSSNTTLSVGASDHRAILTTLHL